MNRPNFDAAYQKARRGILDDRTVSRPAFGKAKEQDAPLMAKRATAEEVDALDARAQRSHRRADQA